MKKQIVIAALFMVAIMAIVSTASAAQYGPYGGQESSANIMVDKLVAVPHDNKGSVTYTYVDNLSRTDYKFKSGNYIFFKIKVQNTSNKTLTNVTVEDTFPMYLEVFPENYTYDKSSRKLTLSMGTLEKGETKEVTLKARVLQQAQLPSDQGLFCIVNSVKAWSGSVSDTDNAQLCIEKQVMGTDTKGGVPAPKEIPSTGAEFPLFMTLASVSGYLGMKLRNFKKS